MFELETGIWKRQAVLDLDVAGQAQAMRDLIGGADVFSQGYRLGTPGLTGRRLGLVLHMAPGTAAAVLAAGAITAVAIHVAV